MTEPVRAVVWDLDQTFWQGILTEGAVTLIDRNKEIVVELARRGIISSICSKNELCAVKDILIQMSIWDFFVMPSITWEPKGPRIKTLINKLSLRPSTVLFIDDNPSNLEEARFWVPDIQVKSDTFIDTMLDHPALRGDNSNNFSRLNQYKLLEQRKNDELILQDDHRGFLRESEIKVQIEFDVEKHLDRFIEIINRTNQLNFTKTRFSSNLDEARFEVKNFIRAYGRQVGLIRVVDRYGDHGFCGAYSHNSEERKLEHFAFSCRVLGMGVEQWLYQKLGRPKISIQPEVVTDLLSEESVDWVTLVQEGAGNTPSRSPDTQKHARITARGACDLGAVIHYFRATTHDAIGEYHTFRDGGTFRIDHSFFLRHAINGVSPDQMQAAKSLGYLAEDFTTRMFETSQEQNVVLLSFAADSIHGLYKHNRTDLVLPFTFSIPHLPPSLDIRMASDDQISPGGTLWRAQALSYLRQEFDYLGLISEPDLSIICHLP